MNRSKDSESISLEALRSGNRPEFARLVDKHYEMVYRLALKILNNTQDAEDVLQETFIKALRYLPDFDGRSSLSTWLYRIATNEALMVLRKHKVDVISVDEPGNEEGEQEPLQIVDWCCLPENELMSNEAQKYLDHAIDQLPASLKVVFVLRDLQGMSTQETSEALGLSETAVKTRLSRARLRLREELTTYFGEQMIEGKHT